MSSNPSRRMRRQTQESNVHRNGHGIMFPQPQVPQQAAVQVAAPLSTDYLIGLIAAHLCSNYDMATDALVAERAVNLATEIFARAHIKVASGAAQARVQALAAEERRKADPDPAA